jgi:NADH-quinone oxidoreductase subunit J
MFVGAQFLGIATVVVYAGAIVVTFLFVLMLAQPQGHDYYDRLSWEPLLSALTGAVMVLLLSLALESGLGGTTAAELTAKSPTPAALEKGVLAPEHVAQIGGVLFSRYLIAVEVAGVLLLVALVGASAIIAHQQGAKTSLGSSAQEDRR